jgi:hypothetical protein
VSGWPSGSLVTTCLSGWPSGSLVVSGGMMTEEPLAIAAFGLTFCWCYGCCLGGTAILLHCRDLRNYHKDTVRTSARADQNERKPRAVHEWRDPDLGTLAA